jgi:hypothetical protein
MVVCSLPNPFQKLELFYRLKPVPTFVSVVGIDPDLLFAAPVVISSIDGGRWADLVHESHGE